MHEKDIMNNRSAIVSTAFLLTALAAPVLHGQTPATLNVEVSRPKAAVSPTLYGLMTEEINYSYDGGLYAELVRNRTFRSDWTGILNWFLIEKGTASAKMSVDTEGRAIDSAPLERETRGHQGRCQQPGRSPQRRLLGNRRAAERPVYRVVLRQERFRGRAAGADCAGGGPIRAGSRQSVGLGDRKRLEGVQVRDAVRKCRSVLRKPSRTDHRQTRDSVAPTGFPVPAHLSRPARTATASTSWRSWPPCVPRSCASPAETTSKADRIETRFDWKKMIGPLVDRPTHPTTWSYHSTDGMGLLEFLEWCEDLHMQPLLGVYAGYSLGGQVVKPGPDLDPYVQEGLEEIEYVTGGTDTKWGAVRARDGHPAPFTLRYVEVGNEDNFDRAKTYDGRYAQFYKAIKAKYPNLQVIATMPVKGMTPDVVDDHYYKREQGMFDEARHYDNTDRNGPKIFVGEWATREGTPTPNFGAALGDAAFLTGLERNSDVVVMSAYAPLFVNVNPGGMQWSSDLIGYDALNSYGSPSYYAQVMFASCLGDHTLDSSVSGAGDKFFYSVTASAEQGVLEAGQCQLRRAAGHDRPERASARGRIRLTSTR